MARARDDDPTDAEGLLRWVDDGRLPRTPVHACPYVAGRDAREQGFLAERLDGELYHELMDRGFRRSGRLFYATDCPSCRACVPLRVPVATFTPSRSQRRVLRRNADVAVHARPPRFEPATYELYRRYLAFQHPGSEQDDGEASFRAAFLEPVVDSVELRYTVGDQLVAVSVLDVCTRSVSAVYHCFDPAHADRSLGVFSVLAEIDWTRRLGVPHYYLGYWVSGAPTMQYKANYAPHELLRDGEWR